MSNKNNNWIKLESLEQLKEVKKSKNLSLLFKHSTRCSISSMAKARLDKGLNQLADFDCYYLDLIAHRDISAAIADQFQVHHESPQVVLVKDGESYHDTSHLDISIAEIKEATDYINKK